MAAPPAHTYGPTCALYTEEEDNTDKGPIDELNPPRAKAQFFYISALPIDDPLSPIPPVADLKASKSKAPPQPFSVKDSNALEEAWQGLRTGEQSRPSTSRSQGQASGDRLGDGLRPPRSSSHNRREQSTGPTQANMLINSEDEGNGFTDNLKGASRKAIPRAKLGGDKYATRKEAKGLKKVTKKPSKAEARQALHQEAVAAEGQSTKMPTSNTDRGRHVGPSAEGQIQDDVQEETQAGRSGPDRRAASNEGIRSRISAKLASSPLRQHSRGRVPQTEASNISPIPTPTGVAEESSRSRSREEYGEEQEGTYVLLGDAPEHREEVGDYFDEHDLDKHASLETPDTRKKSRIPMRSRSRGRKAEDEDSPLSKDQVAGASDPVDGAAALSSSADMHTSGNPFARAPSHRKISFKQSFQRTTDTRTAPMDMKGGRAPTRNELDDRSTSRSTSRGKAPRHDRLEEARKAYIPVGIAKLHLVELPEMMMKPIYWSPIHDVARVIRATWFYKNTMSPVEPDVANRLELGYEDFKPWTNTWQDELNSCMEHGPDAELKVTRRLWPEDDRSKESRPGTSAEMKAVTDDAEQDEEPLELPEHSENVAVSPVTKSRPTRMFASHSVIYVDGRNAQLLRPSLAPSPARKRSVLGAVRKGREIGIAVVRGFDRKSWETLHPAKKLDAQTANAKIGAFMSQSGDAATQGRRSSCTACRMNEQTRPAVTDLILVIHGIGQKLSERMETFNFTHAINGFRRQVNIELVSEAVRGNLREGMGGVMVLPINWRLTLTFDEHGRPTSDDNKHDPTANDFTLEDITPETLPAVRSMISDVMLDIPYYLSHHKEKMVSAVIKEANRVYRLWCRNNPGFQENGRVHLIAHSLGSAMSLDILSQQPTTVPTTLDMKAPCNERFFEFDTKALFCCGSPAGFFLLLNKANLLPRKGRRKPGFDGEDEGPGVAGSAGTYGCLAVDNFYNVMHYNDPIAYHMNAAVDVEYAHMLKPATIPTASTGWLSSISNAFKWSSTASEPATTTSSGRPHLSKLPTTVELNTHDFTREEVAEKRMYLLNDNGQVDFFLSSGGGPLEIQYLNMLSAHSSYWILRDFVRFIVMEVGRSTGREGTIPVLRAEKRRVIKAGKIS